MHIGDTKGQDRAAHPYRSGKHCSRSKVVGVYERSQMISSAIGRPTPNDPPMINAIARSKPSPARNSCHDMPLLLQGRCPRIHLTVVVNDSRPHVVPSAGAATQRQLASVNSKTKSETSSISPYVSIKSEGTGSNLLRLPQNHRQAQHGSKHQKSRDLSIG